MPLILPIDLRNPDPAMLHQAAAVVRRGGVIVYPTETLYGIGADARNAEAVRRVIRTKRRRDGKPILVIVPTRASVEPLVSHVSLEAGQLMDSFWPGSLTLVFRAAVGIPEEITQGRGTIGIRIPSSNVCLQLLELAGCPITSTSANVSGQAAARTVGEIFAVLAEEVDLYLDGGELPQSRASTVVDVSSGIPVVLREGALATSLLREVVPALRAASESG